jgi:phospholipid transport system substrate-binding protein
MMYRRWVSSLVVAGLPWVGMTGEALDQIRRSTDKILAVVQDPAMQGPAQAVVRDRRVRSLIDERFDWGAMARSAMGAHWKTLSESQRQEFSGLFSELIKNNYLAEVEGYSGEKIRYQSETVAGKYGVVNVVILTLRGTDVPVSYRVLQKESGWFVYDITIEGVSMVNNYRSQIGAILQRSNYDGLVAKLRGRIAENKPGPPPAQAATENEPKATERKP